MGKNKDPAVLFYTSDFLADTTLWTYEELGRYIKLLCIQHLQDGVSEDDFIAVSDGYKRVVDKFALGDDGKYRNKRMQAEQERRQAYSESRSKNGKFGGRPKNHMLSICEPYEKHSENENINENKDISIANNIFSFSNNNNIEMIESASAREMEDENDVVYMASDGPVTRKKLKELALESQFESQVREYFKGLYFDKDSSAPSPFISSAELFIIYNRARGWKGHGGVDLTKDDRWVAYADEWERKERLKK